MIWIRHRRWGYFFMSTTNRRRIGKIAGAVAVAAAVCAGAVVSANAAFASSSSNWGDHALRAEFVQPAPVAPGGVGDVEYHIQNVGKTATGGTMLVLSLPAGISMPTISADPNCKQTSKNEDGGAIITCNLTDASGQFAPGQQKVTHTRYVVSPLAAPGTTLGRLGASATPLKYGLPTEDWQDVKGPNTAWTPITTSG